MMQMPIDDAINYLTNKHMMNTRVMQRGFNVSLMQIRRGYFARFGVRLPSRMAFRDAAQMVIEDMGYVAGRALLEAQSNDVAIDENGI